MLPPPVSARFVRRYFPQMRGTFPGERPAGKSVALIIQHSPAVCEADGSVEFRRPRTRRRRARCGRRSAQLRAPMPKLDDVRYTSPSQGPEVMRVIDPSTDELLRDVEEDDAASISEKYGRARDAQRAWARTPLAERQACIERFRGLVIDRGETLARTLSSEMGKPISQSRNELNGLLGRIDFFLERVAHELEDEVVLDSESEGI